MLLMSLVAFITELLPLPIRLDIQGTKNSGLEIIHSFIHSGDLYSASSRVYYSEALPAQSRTKKKDFFQYFPYF